MHINNNRKINNIFINNNYVPIWLMRQAGRYLPEYMEVRNKNTNFLEFCYSPILSKEVTIQPIKRFNLDAAIIFSDILVILDSLGSEVTFKKNHGPIIKTNLDKFIAENKNLKLEQKITTKLQPIYEAITLTRKELPQNQSLIGFSGAFWTLFAYLIEGQGSKNFHKAKQYYYNNPKSFLEIKKILCSAISIHLKNQIKAGSDVVKIFDSWTGVLSEQQKRDLVITPTKEILDTLQEERKTTKIICFPKGIGNEYKNFAKLDFDILALDYSFPIEKSQEIYQTYNKAIQGNLDPALLLVKDKNIFLEEADRILTHTKNIPFIFNLGHGILPNTPIENVSTLVEKIHNERNIM